MGWLVASVAVLAAPNVPTAQTADATRTVYITVADKKGQWVPDLTAADFIVKEGGKSGIVASAGPAAARPRIALIVEAGLEGDPNIRTALNAFVGKILDRAEIAIIVAASRDMTIVDYTRDSRALIDAISRFRQVQLSQAEHLAEGIYETARVLAKSEADRRVIVALGVDRDNALSMDPQQIIDELVRDRVTLFVASLPGLTGGMPLGAMGDAVGLAQVLGDGSKHSGGRRQQATISAGFAAILTDFADEILNQYEVKYTLPAGTRSDGRLNISTRRRDVVIRAPSQVPKR
jgi:hypothetical protein